MKAELLATVLRHSMAPARIDHRRLRIGFVVANTLHYGLSRTWIFRGTERGRASGYALFLINAVIGLVVTVTLYAAILEFTAIHYLVARVIVSLVAGLMVFVLNAVFNFRQI